MKKIQFPLVFIVVSLLIFSCKKQEGLPEVTFPTVSYSVNNETIQVNNTSIVVGPSKIYEQDSYVVYKLTLGAEKSLKQLRAEVSADYIALDSKVIASEPAGVCTEVGDFTSNVKQAVVYYQLHIHPLVKPQSKITVTFSVLDNKSYQMKQPHTFTVVKKGSSAGKAFRTFYMLTGTQESLRLEVPTVTGGSPIVFNADNLSNVGQYFSLDIRTSFSQPSDALRNSDKIDWIGYKYQDVPFTSPNWALGLTVSTVRTNTVPAYENGWCFVSPYDTVTLVTDTLRMGYYLAGYSNLPLPTPNPFTVGTLISRYLAYNQSYGALVYMARNVSKFKVKNKVQFKKLLLTPDEFDQFSHDNEVATLAQNSTYAWDYKTRRLQPDDVYAFRRADGSMGMFKVTYVPLSTYNAVIYWIKY
jgi:hypothetical protein